MDATRVGVQGALGTEDVRAADGTTTGVDVGRVVRAGQRCAKVWNGLLDVHATGGAGDDEMASCVYISEQRGVEFTGLFSEWCNIQGATVGFDVEGVELGEAASDAATGGLDIEAGGKEGG